VLGWNGSVTLGLHETHDISHDLHKIRCLLCTAATAQLGKVGFGMLWSACWSRLTAT
jgi:hypothetical protein